jgi:hypothetical protein
MIALLCFLVILFASPFKSKSRLEAENAALRRQLIIFQRKMRGRVHLTLNRVQALSPTSRSRKKQEPSGGGRQCA